MGVWCRDCVDLEVPGYTASTRKEPDGSSSGWCRGLSTVAWNSAAIRRALSSPGRDRMKMTLLAIEVGQSSRMASCTGASICTWPTTRPFGPSRASSETALKIQQEADLERPKPPAWRARPPGAESGLIQNLYAASKDNRHSCMPVSPWARTSSNHARPPSTVGSARIC